MAIQTNRLNSELLNAALLGLEEQKRRIEKHLEHVRSLLGVGADGQKRRGRPAALAKDESDTPLVARGPRKRRRFSAETRAKIAAAQQKRWARIKKESEHPRKQSRKSGN